MTAPLTPEEVEVIRREAALYGPSADASRVGQIRRLLTELDRVRNLPREGDLEAIRDTERELDRVTAERDAIAATRTGVMAQRDAAYDRVVEAERQTNKYERNWYDARAERNAAQSSARAWQEKAVELEGALAKIDAIRNSIVGTQTLNWSAHAYPLVAALEEAGFKGEGYEIARAKALTLIQARDIALAEAKRLREALEEIRPDCEQCGASATRMFRTEGDGPYWLCDSTDAEHGEEFYCGEEVELPKLRAALAPHPAPEPKR